MPFYAQICKYKDCAGGGVHRGDGAVERGDWGRGGRRGRDQPLKPQPRTEHHYGIKIKIF